MPRFFFFAVTVFFRVKGVISSFPRAEISYLTSGTFFKLAWL